MHIFARLTRCMLGPTAIAKHKLQHANPLPVLGINVGIGKAGVIFQPEAEKVARWKEQIREASASKKLHSGDASSLAGRLSWGSQHIFRRHMHFPVDFRTTHY